LDQVDGRIGGVPPLSSPPAEETVRAALLGVIDPELGDNIVDLGMVRGVRVEPDGQVRVEVALTVAGCPLRTQLHNDVVTRVGSLPGVRHVEVVMGEMDAIERGALMDRARRKAQEDRAVSTDIPATARIMAVSSGKGGVGKSTWRSRWPSAASSSACSTPISGASRSPACSGCRES
jgi:ATP-binding protein involved in chromosome partitioning